MCTLGDWGIAQLYVLVNAPIRQQARAWKVFCIQGDELREKSRYDQFVLKSIVFRETRLAARTGNIHTGHVSDLYIGNGFT